MPYRSETIEKAVKSINRSYYLPSFQREYVWKSDQVIKLFDSILRGYPISSFLFWQVEEQQREHWQIYEFVRDASHLGVHNQIASTHGVRDLLLVLDGQQRLTSLFIGLRGTYAIRKQGKPKAIPDRYRLYINLLKDPHHNADDVQTGSYYDLEFHATTPRISAGNYWYAVGDILNFDSQDSYYDFRDGESERIPGEKRRVFLKNLDRPYASLRTEEVISYYIETSQDLERVLDIFIRANEGGTKLSKSDLLFSMVTSFWTGMNARNEVFGFLDEINGNSTRRNNFDKDFIMKSFLVLSDLPVVYKVQNFTINNLETIRYKWPDIQSAIMRSVNLINTFGIDGTNLTSVNALMPVVLFALKHPEFEVSSTDPFASKNKILIQRWLIMALLRGAFGRASDGLLTSLRAVIRELNPRSDFPVNLINDELTKTGLATDNASLANTVLSRKYGEKLSFLALSLLNDSANWGVVGSHIDHLFPKQGFNNFPAENENMNALVNLCLLRPNENVGKQDMPLDEWLATRDQSFFRQNLIPTERRLWKFNNRNEFWLERERLIKLRISNLFI